MRIANTLSDLKELFTEYQVTTCRKGDKVFLLMNPTEDWEPDENERAQLAARTKPVIPNDPPSLQFNRATRNTILEMCLNPQFWRCTTVADQMTNFYGADGGTFPPMHPGKREPSRSGILRLTKKAGEPFTIHFASERQAIVFVEAVKYE